MSRRDEQGPSVIQVEHLPERLPMLTLGLLR